MTTWQELASRENDGLRVGLQWSAASNRVKVDVIDERLDRSFEFDVDPAHALSAFYHPFAYAPEQHLRGTACDPLDLQPQN